MDEKMTPTHRKFGAKLDAVFDEIGEPGDLTLEQMRKITSVCLPKTASDEYGTAVDISFEAFASVLKKHPEASEDIQAALQCLVIAITFHANEDACEKIEIEMKRQSGIVNRNEAIQQTILRARAIAKMKWSEDTDQLVRIGEMAQIVREALVDEGFDDLPKNSSIADWIRPDLAPDYAKSGGRRKNPPRRHG